MELDELFRDLSVPVCFFAPHFARSMCQMWTNIHYTCLHRRLQ